MRDQHLSRERLADLAKVALSPAETSEAADHLFHCSYCWIESIEVLAELDARARQSSPDRELHARIERDPALAALVQRYRLEQRRLEERLMAHSAIRELRRLTMKQRRQEVIKRKPLRLRAVVEEMLSEARKSLPLEAEEWANLSMLLCRQLPGVDFTEAARADLLAECLAELASARRRSARWSAARLAIKEGREQAEKGSGDLVLKGNLVALEGVMDGDIGSLDDAEASLLQAKEFFEQAGEPSLVGKALAQLAYIWIDADPTKSILYLSHARRVIAPDEIRLRTLCEINRTDCLITLGAIRKALLQFSETYKLCEQFTDPFVQLRLRFLEGRLLEAMERFKEADSIFREVISVDLEQRSTKAYFLDLAYLFGSYIRRGDAASASAVCSEALAQLSDLDLGDNSEAPIRDLWSGLKRRAESGTVGNDLLERSRRYIRSQWSFLGGDPLASRESPVR